MTAAYSCGMMLNSFAFFGFKHWKTAFLWIYVIPLLFIIFFIGRFIEKTPIDLLSSDNCHEIKMALSRIAEINGIENLELNEAELLSLKEEYEDESKNDFFNPLHILKFRSLRVIAIPIMLANFVSNYIFYAPSFIQQDSDLFLGNIISGISYLVSCFVTQIVL